VKIHRAIVLIAMMLLAVGALALLIADAGGKSLVALAIVLVAAAIGGVAFSWKRYFQPPVK
jgi:hypothetical protein